MRVPPLADTITLLTQPRVGWLRGDTGNLGQRGSLTHTRWCQSASVGGAEWTDAPVEICKMLLACLSQNLPLRRRCANDGAASPGSEGNTAAGGISGDPEHVSGEGKK